MIALPVHCLPYEAHFWNVPSSRTQQSLMAQRGVQDSVFRTCAPGFSWPCERSCFFTYLRCICLNDEPLHLLKALAGPTLHQSKERCYKRRCTYSPFPAAAAAVLSLGGIPNSGIN